jgi:hypothetical protein
MADALPWRKPSCGLRYLSIFLAPQYTHGYFIRKFSRMLAQSTFAITAYFRSQICEVCIN